MSTGKAMSRDLVRRRAFLGVGAAGALIATARTTTVTSDTPTVVAVPAPLGKRHAPVRLL